MAFQADLPLLLLDTSNKVLCVDAAAVVVTGDEVVGSSFELLVPGCCALGQLCAFSSCAILFFSELRYFPIGSYLVLRFMCAAWGGREGLEEKMMFIIIIIMNDRRNTE